MPTGAGLLRSTEKVAPLFGTNFAQGVLPI